LFPGHTHIVAACYLRGSHFFFTSNTENLAKWPPTAANIQPLRVLDVRTQAGRDRLVTHMADGNKAKTASAPAVAVLAIDTDFHEPVARPAAAPRRGRRRPLGRA
jgi:nitroreductase